MRGLPYHFKDPFFLGSVVVILSICLPITLFVAFLAYVGIRNLIVASLIAFDPTPSRIEKSASPFGIAAASPNAKIDGFPFFGPFLEDN